MKRNAIARLIVYSLLALVLTGVLVTGLRGEFHLFQTSLGGIVEGSAEYDPAQVQKLEISWASGHVILTKDDVEQITIRQSRTGDKNENMRCALSNGTLKIDYNKRGLHIGTLPEKDLHILVPWNWDCKELEIDGAGLIIELRDVNIDELSINGAGCQMYLSGGVQEVGIDGAGCDITLNCTDRPKSIEVDGAGCVLSLTLPESCGFQLEMDGMGCELETDLLFTKGDGVYISGNGHCKIEINGLGCEVAIGASTSNNMTYPVRCGDDFTAGLLLETLDAEYAPGTIITIKTPALTDVDLELYVNGKFVCNQTEYRAPDGSNHWEFQFTMLSEPVVIHFKTVDGIPR